MKSFLQSVFEFCLRLEELLIPRFIRVRADASKFAIETFLKNSAAGLRTEDRILDAGAGGCKYEKFFSHVHYESTDFDFRTCHEYICSLDHFPIAEHSYDAIVNTQVLEHVEYPQLVLEEFFRILKPGGRLFLTAPQGWGIHGEPHHYFHFTNFGLESLFTHAGFRIESIKPKGGMFWYLAKRVKTIPSEIFLQTLFERTEGSHRKQFHFRPTAVLLFPFYLIALPLCGYLIPLMLFYLDFLDRECNYTLGYTCICTKPESS